MKIMSFNTLHCCNFLTDKIDFKLMADVIKNSGADVVGLNEMHGFGLAWDYTNQTKKLAALTGIENYYFAKAVRIPCGGPFGNSLLSKYSITSAQSIPVPDPAVKTGKALYETRGLLKAKLENGFTVMVIHFGLNADEQENAVKTVLENLETEKCILMGDFNVEPHMAVLEPIKQRMLDAGDYITGNKFTFPADKPCKKIDYIFLSKDLSVKSAEIPDVIASDHRPHLCEIY